jgi:hypothetical protein
VSGIFTLQCSAVGQKPDAAVSVTVIGGPGGRRG